MPTRQPRRLRADARRNHEQLLAAAREVFVGAGPALPLDEVARRAGVGIATLYRRFGDRQGCCARSCSTRSNPSAAAGALEAAGRGPGTARRRWPGTCTGVLDLRVSAVMPLVLDRLDLNDPESRPAREASAAAVRAAHRPAHEDGSCPARSASVTSGPCWCGCPGRCPARCRPISTTSWRTGTSTSRSPACAPTRVLQETGLSRQELRERPERIDLSGLMSAAYAAARSQRVSF